MSILTPEIPSQYGALDSAGMVDGDPASAHVLREIVRGANRLMCRGERLINWVWDYDGVLTETTPSGGLAGFGFPFWFKPVACPITVPKKPGLTKAKMWMRFYARSGERLFFQVATRRTGVGGNEDGFNLPTDSPNVVSITGTGAWQTVTLANIPIHEGDFDSISFYLYGQLTTSTASLGGAGLTPTAGSCTPSTVFAIYDIDGAGTWNTTGTTFASIGCGVIVEDHAARPYVPARWITGVEGNGVNLGNHLLVFPRLSDAEVQSIAQAGTSATYRIYELPRYRIANIALYATDRGG